jgi:hypothetical protein
MIGTKICQKCYGENCAAFFSDAVFLRQNSRGISLYENAGKCFLSEKTPGKRVPFRKIDPQIWRRFPDRGNPEKALKPVSETFPRNAFWNFHQYNWAELRYHELRTNFPADQPTRNVVPSGTWFPQEFHSRGNYVPAGTSANPSIQYSVVKVVRLAVMVSGRAGTVHARPETFTQ